jgi:hypothetical protein
MAVIRRTLEWRITLTLIRPTHLLNRATPPKMPATKLAAREDS